MATKAGSGAGKKAGTKSAKKKGAPFSSVAGAFDAANDATMALGPLAGLAREDFIGAIGLMLRQTAANPDKAAGVAEKPQSLGWFVGQVMKATGGKANPAAINALVAQKLGL